VSTAATLPPASEVPLLDRAVAPGPGPGPAGRPFREPEPLVTVCVPMRDEAGAIEACLDGFAAQTHPLDRLEVLVVDGGSTDGSRQTLEVRAAQAAWIRVVDNPHGTAAAAFNCGLRVARGEVFCLFSAHGVPDPRYVERSVAVLAETGATGVGGRYLHVGTDPASNAVGRAMVSPVGMASPHRFARDRAVVDTISHPAYRAEDLAGIGEFDERLERNSDYEFNWRLRQAGRTLLFDPSVESVYRPRPSLKALGRQFWAYGRWKKRVLSRNPGSFRPRHLVAPAFAASLAAAPVLAWSPGGRRLLAAELAAYAVLVAAGTLHARPDEHNADVATLAACFPVMHACWGAGFLTSVLEDLLGGEEVGS
jgi:glycosyltransferase involved in cell wall biosynthesis